ncbi:MAG TPA: Cof-type HAD-IIB family hydrolase, partial [candidate division Zixibacteria bacterium]|nr:Cof-type HAD-IIB family hydrolase [candidate division Zixibacteria bacterium]
EAGIRAAVANAHQDIIDMSDYVSPYSCDQDGVADIIEKVILS